MLNGDKNIKDSHTDLDIAVRDNSISLPYPKLKKLITALYIVTDIMDTNEPIRLQLRTAGVQILSDINLQSRTNIKDKVLVLLSFIDIASTLNLISEMNARILRKEFIELNDSIKDPYLPKRDHVWLEEFLKPTETVPDTAPFFIEKNKENKGALSLSKESSNMLKKQRRDEIINAIKANNYKATIGEIKVRASGSISDSSEKTLQRELSAMVKDSILIKTGEKRWSKYELKNNDF